MIIVMYTNPCGKVLYKKSGLNVGIRYFHLRLMDTFSLLKSVHMENGQSLYQLIVSCRVCPVFHATGQLCRTEDSGHCLHNWTGGQWTHDF